MLAANSNAARLLTDRMTQAPAVVDGSGEQTDAQKYLDPNAVSKKDLPRLKKRLDALHAQFLAIDKKDAAALGQMGAAIAERQMLRNQIAAIETGQGIYQGNQYGPDDHTVYEAPDGVTATDCTLFVEEILGTVFAQLGRKAEWDSILSEAVARSESRYRANKLAPQGLSGHDLQLVLQSRLGWKGVFFAADANSSDAGGEHKTQAAQAKNRGTYHQDLKAHTPGVAVDREKLVVNYRPDEGNAAEGTKATGTQRDTLSLQHLRQLPFGLVSVRGGTHLTFISHGRVIEAHWDRAPGDANTIQATDLGDWDWMSGAVVAPAADIERAWAQPVDRPVPVGESLDPGTLATYAKQVGDMVRQAGTFNASSLASYLDGSRAPDNKLQHQVYVLNQLTYFTPDLKPQTLDELGGPALYQQCCGLMNWRAAVAKYFAANHALLRAGYAELGLALPELGTLSRHDALVAIAPFKAKAKSHFTHAVARAFDCVTTIENASFPL
ncbi:MAG: hypothetical protein ABI321_08620 [Polyangia bacterium]